MAEADVPRESAAPAAGLRIVLAIQRGPRQVDERTIELPAGATVADALRLTGREGPVSVWGRAAPPQQALRDGDRVEWCRPLRVDPKVARRERFRGQGSRKAGLFAGRRPPPSELSTATAAACAPADAATASPAVDGSPDGER